MNEELKDAIKEEVYKQLNPKKWRVKKDIQDLKEEINIENIIIDYYDDKIFIFATDSGFCDVLEFLNNKPVLGTKFVFGRTEVIIKCISDVYIGGLFIDERN